MSQFLDNTKKLTKKSRKKILGHNFLKQIMSQLLDNTKKIERKKIEKNYFGSELSEAINEPTFRFLNFYTK